MVTHWEVVSCQRCWRSSSQNPARQEDTRGRSICKRGKPRAEAGGPPGVGLPAGGGCIPGGAAPLVGAHRGLLCPPTVCPRILGQLGLLHFGGSCIHQHGRASPDAGRCSQFWRCRWEVGGSCSYLVRFQDGLAISAMLSSDRRRSRKALNKRTAIEAAAGFH